ncbi:winged helix-turn-helix domain-containing protein [Streptomyces pseudogriseolus]|uniref:GntR family transcriptional regulator n=1 Tax=Streptomyces pseudogriseolus TaxID=36817 RepID=UPI0034977780
MTESAGLPLYRWQEVAADLREQIKSGRLPVGARLPGERLLCEEYGAALGTVRRAVRELKEEGLIASLPAKGTYVIAVPEGDGETPSAGD